MLLWILVGLVIFGIAVFVFFCAFFDQAVFNRPGTIYHVPRGKKRLAITFDDGPSPLWTPKILDELKKYNVLATFFMIGYHVQKYPDVARRVAQEGHTVANHGYAHSVIVYYTMAEIEAEIKYTEHVIREITGKTTRYYRPPKAWIKTPIKNKIKSMGYEIILWSLNSKDWVGFSHHSIVSYLTKNLKDGDILLFHDSGNVTGMEGGNRTQTVLTLGPLIAAARAQGYEFVNMEQMLKDN